MDKSDYSSEEKKQLLTLARKTIEAELKKTHDKTEMLSGLSEKFKEIRSCFVTLHNADGSLRGCIGNIQAFEPLVDNVINNALNSAFNDYRFNQVVSLEELADLVIEISVLTPMEDVSSYEDFIVGEHGVVLLKNGRSAVFLPQVAPEQHWDRDTTLRHLSMKAGLSPDAWMEPDAQFKVFRAIVFSETEF
jgi:AmmeMemoRadiSam system protein A